MLLAAGLAERLGARHAGRVAAPKYNLERGPKRDILDPVGLHDYAIALADAVNAGSSGGRFPIVLSLTAPSAGDHAGLRGLGRYGFIYIDGDADFYAPEHEPDPRRGVGERRRFRRWPRS